MNTSLMTLIVYIVVLLPLMLLGFFFARRKMFNPHHKLTMTLVVILNWALIIAIMLGSYSDGVATGLPDNLSDINALLPTIHGIVGFTAQLMATYLMLLMWTENTAVEGLIPFRIKNIKTPMRITLTLWIITVLMGFGIYSVWYGGSTESDTAPPPAATEEVEATENDEEATAPDATEEAETTEDTEEVEEAPAPDTTEEADE